MKPPQAAHPFTNDTQKLRSNLHIKNKKIFADAQINLEYIILQIIYYEKMRELSVCVSNFMFMEGYAAYGGLIYNRDSKRLPCQQYNYPAGSGFSQNPSYAT